MLQGVSCFGKERDEQAVMKGRRDFLDFSSLSPGCGEFIRVSLTLNRQTVSTNTSRCSQQTSKRSYKDSDGQSEMLHPKPKKSSVTEYLRTSSADFWFTSGPSRTTSASFPLRRRGRNSKANFQNTKVEKGTIRFPLDQPIPYTHSCGRS